MENGYQRSVNRFYEGSMGGIVLIVACLCGIIYFIGRIIASELAPMEDRSQFRLQVTAPEGTAFDYMDKYIDRLTNFIWILFRKKKLY